MQVYFLYRRVSIYYVSERLGHKNIDTAHENYFHVIQDCVKKMLTQRLERSQNDKCYPCVKNFKNQYASIGFFVPKTKRKTLSNPFVSRLESVFLYTLNLSNLFLQTSQEGFEPPTDALEGRCSIQLSY